MPQYNVQSGVCDNHKLILSTYVSDEVNDKRHLVEMTHRCEEELNVQIQQVYADSDYYAIEAIEELEDQGKEVYVAVSQAGQSKVIDEQGQEVQFIYNAEQDVYRCSKGKELKLISQGVKNGRKAKRYQSKDCRDCPIREACTGSKIGRTIYRHENAERVEAYKKKMKSAWAKAMLKKRRCAVEHPFGTIRSIQMSYIPLLLRGRPKVQTEIDLYHLGYNFKRVCNIAGPEVLRYQIEQYDWKAAAEAIRRADQKRKEAKYQKKVA